MTRLEELTLKLADGVMTDEEASELLSLLESDASLRAEHIKLLQLEATLRGQRQSDVTARIMSHVNSTLGDRITQSAMTTIREVRRSKSDVVKKRRQPRSTPNHSRQGSSAKRFPYWIISVAAAAMIVFGVVISRSTLHTPQTQDQGLAADTIGEVVMVDNNQHSGRGPMLIRHGAADSPLVPKAKLLARDRITTSRRNTSERGSESVIDVVLINGVKCSIGSESDFELTAQNDLKLNSGSIYLTSASSSSVIVRTMHGNVKASKAAFELIVARDKSQLSVESGVAEFGSDGSGGVSLCALQRSIARLGRASPAESLHPSSFNQWKSVSAQVALPNLLDNPGFEKALLGWNVGKALKAMIVTTDVHAGERSLHFHNVKKKGLKDKWDGVIFQNIRIQGGKEYVVSGWSRSELVASGRVLMVWYVGADTSEIKEEVIGKIGGANFNWVKLEIRVRAPDNASLMRLVFAPEPTQVASMWLDDWVVQEVAP